MITIRAFNEAYVQINEYIQFILKKQLSFKKNKKFLKLYA